MRDLETCWQLLGRRDLEGITKEDVANCAKTIAEVVPQDYRAGKMISDLGEVWACVLLHLDRKEPGTKGYDAKDRKDIVKDNGERLACRYQIKTRSPQVGEQVNEAGTTGGFTNFEFDYALLVLLDSKLQPYYIGKMDSQTLEKNCRKRGDIVISRFRKNGKPVYERERP